MKVLDGPHRQLAATVDVPASKSLTNRALIAAAAAGGGVVANPLDCEDTRLLAAALDAAGWPVEWSEAIHIGPRRPVGRPVRVDLGNSGTGARLIIGLLAATPGDFTIDGTSRLRERPMRPLVDALRSMGSRIDSSDGFLPIHVEGTLMEGGRVEIRPEVSSQFVSSLLLAGTLMTGGLELRISGELPSKPYVDLTLDVLAAFDVAVEHEAGSSRYVVPAGTARPQSIAVEGDWSAAAFFAAAASVAGGEVSVGPLSATSRQGDRVVCEILRSAGVEVVADNRRTVFRGPVNRPLEADVRDCPDLFPALAVVAVSAPPGSSLTGLDHLQHKESDRFSVMVANLERLGCGFDLRRNGCRVTAGLRRVPEPPPEVTAADDHRIAMAMAVAALLAGPIRLDRPECVAKSFPGFWGVWAHMLDQTGEGEHQP